MVEFDGKHGGYGCAGTGLQDQGDHGNHAVDAQHEEEKSADERGDEQAQENDDSQFPALYEPPISLPRWSAR